MTDISEQSRVEEDDDIIFIVGSLRSGTTLLRLMVDHHEALSNPAEMDFLFDYAHEGANSSNLTDIWAKFESKRVFRRLNLKIDRSLEYRDLIKSLVNQCRIPGKKLTINIHRNFQRIPAIFPEARYIHILRDPRDVARSSIAMGWAGNVYYGIDQWIETERDFEKLREITKPNDILELRLEELLANPETVLTSLCNFAGVTYSDSMLSYPQSTTYEAPDPKMSYGWKKKLSDREIGLVEHKAGPLFVKSGYDLSGVELVKPGIWDRLVLREENRFGKFQFSVKRHGFWMAALGKLNRFIPIPAIRRAITTRLEARDLQFLK